MANPYRTAGAIIKSSPFHFWRVVRRDGTFVGLFPKEHFRAPCDVRNMLKLMARAYDHGVADAAPLPQNETKEIASHES